MRKTFMLAVAMLLGFIGSLFAANPSYAVGNCPANWICFYDTSTSASPIESRDGADTAPGECHYMPSGANNKTSYIWNRAGHAWSVFPSTGCLNWSGHIYANSSGSMNSATNNNISSYKSA